MIPDASTLPLKEGMYVQKVSRLVRLSKGQWMRFDKKGMSVGACM
jgi:hypothetical protein